MKRTLLLILPLLISLAVAGQSHSFKTLKKNQPGTTSPGISYVTITPGNSLKSASTGSMPFRQAAMPFPVSARQKIKTVTDGDNSPAFMEREVDPLKSAVADEEKFYAFFEETRHLTGVGNPREAFRIEDMRTDELGMTHIRSVQVYRGIEVYGSQSVLHISPDKERFTGRIVTIHGDVDIHPAISAGDAIKATVADLQAETVYREMSEKEREILQYREPSPTLVIYETAVKKYVLAYEFEIRPNFVEVWKYFVNASTGEIIRKFNSTQSDGAYTANAYDLNGVLRTIGTYLEQGTYYMINISESMFNAASGEGIIMTLDARNTSATNLNYRNVTSSDNSWNAPSAVSAHYNATRTFEYFKNTFNRNSINGNGGNIISFVNVAEDDGSSMENAYWNGQAVFYGNGGSNFKPLAGALDVTTHELGHGVVSNTANLEYYGQPGAINETYADIFGSMVDRDDWLIGEDITKAGFSPSGALRNMKDPNNMGNIEDEYWQPGHVSEMYLGSQDNGGVHINSGIGNHAYYLFATSVSKEKAEQVFYRALTYYLTKTSNFIDLRIAVIQSAKDLYPGSPDDAVRAAEAFDKVGIYQEQQVEEQQDYDVNTGQEYLLCYNTYWLDINTLYKSTAAGKDFVPLTQTKIKGKASVTDNGKFTVFVSADDKIRVINLESGAESILQEDPFWDNVAISKDGGRLAAISNEIDTAIWVYDFGLKQWAKFPLYNPTTSQYGTDAGGVLYADAIEFDHTGQFLMYDAYNELNSSVTDDISYWDIGFIKVWDNSTGAFGDGSISKLFGSLPEDLSVGNAVFSKNSANIIAFDYIDESTKEYAILGVDLESGDLDIIYENTTLGFPSFSNDDSKIAFAAITTSDMEVVGVINLAANKISPSGDAFLLVEDATWPVFYSTGTRKLGLPPVANFSADLKSGSAPLKIQFLDLSVNTPTAWLWSFPGGTPSSSDLQNPVVTYNANGIYQVSLTASNKDGNNTMTKSSFITVSAETAIDNAYAETVTFYPNPVQGVLHISSPRDFRVCLYSLQGSRILECQNTEQVDLSRLVPGVYLLEIAVDDEVFRNKLVKQ